MHWKFTAVWTQEIDTKHGSVIVSAYWSSAAKSVKETAVAIEARSLSFLYTIKLRLYLSWFFVLAPSRETVRPEEYSKAREREREHERHEEGRKSKKLLLAWPEGNVACHIITHIYRRLAKLPLSRRSRWASVNNSFWAWTYAPVVPVTHDVGITNKYVGKK